MTAELAAEAQRIARDLAWITRQTTVVAEAPIKIHVPHEVDAGGAPELAPAFMRWLGPICDCGRQAQCAPGCRFWKDKYLGHLADCEPACRRDERFHARDGHGRPNGLKRALRQVRRLNPKAYDLVYLIVALHYSWDEAIGRLNADRLSRGGSELSEEEYAVLWVSGASLLTAAF